MVHYFINKIKRVQGRPSSCIQCGKSDLKDDAVLATTGPSEKNADYTPAVIGIHHSAGNQATVRGS
jgi:hypothetical protein